MLGSFELCGKLNVILSLRKMTLQVFFSRSEALFVRERRRWRPNEIEGDANLFDYVPRGFKDDSRDGDRGGV